MSVKAVAWAYEQRTGDPVKKSVLVAIADVADDEGYCWPSVALIAFKAEVHSRTVQRHLRSLEAMGLLAVDRERTRPNGSSSSNVYRLPIHVQRLFPTEPLVNEGDNLPPSGNLSPSGKLPPLARGRGEGGAGVTPYEPPSERLVDTPPARARPKKPEGSLIPEGFGISREVREWARRRGYEPYLDLHLEHFLDYAKGGAQGGKPVLALDWEAKFRSCVRADWGDVRMKAQREARANARANAGGGAAPVGKKCFGCASAKVAGSVSGRWYCMSPECRDKAMYGEREEARA